MKLLRLAFTIALIYLVFISFETSFTSCTKTKTVYDTTVVTINDTVTVTVKDTVTINDTLGNLSDG